MQVEHQLGPRPVGRDDDFLRGCHRPTGHAERDVGDLVRYRLEAQDVDRLDAEERHAGLHGRLGEVLLQTLLNRIENARHNPASVSASPERGGDGLLHLGVPDAGVRQQTADPVERIRHTPCVSIEVLVQSSELGGRDATPLRTE